MIFVSDQESHELVANLGKKRDWLENVPIRPSGFPELTHMLNRPFNMTINIVEADSIENAINGDFLSFYFVKDNDENEDA